MKELFFGSVAETLALAMLGADVMNL